MCTCDSDCPSNSPCSGHEPTCSNDYPFSSIVVGSIVRADDLIHLQTAINNERNDSSRRYNSTACPSNDFSSYPFTSGVAVENPVLAQHYDEIKEANNEVTNTSGYGSLITTDFVAQSVDLIQSIIKAIDVTDLQTKINETRNVCICDSHCSCDIDCGCDGECTTDYYYYYYYP